VRHLEIVFETTGLEGDFFLDLVMAAVPEPGLGLLLAFAVATVSRRSKEAGRVANKLATFLG
jgi:mannitol-specific phosphotransferase system IIBC component